MLTVPSKKKLSKAYQKEKHIDLTSRVETSLFEGGGPAAGWWKE